MATTADYLMQLQADKQALVTNLNEKSIEATNDESFTTLVPKIASIQSQKFKPNYIRFQNFEGSYLNFLNDLDTSELTTMEQMFAYCNNLTSIDMSNFKTPKNTSLRYTFMNCKKLTSLDLSNLDTSNVTTMQNTFSGCENIETLNLSNFDTNKVTNMNSMFSGCKNLTSLDLSNFDTSKATMNTTFDNCNKLADLKIKIMNSNCSLSSCTLNVESVSYILQNLGTVTTSKTLTLGTNLAKATEEDLASATEKGWIVN